MVLFPKELLLLLKTSSRGCARDFLVTTGWAKARSSEPNLADFPLPHKLVCSLLLLNLEIALLGCKITAEASPGSFLELPALSYTKSGVMVFRVPHSLVLPWQHYPVQDGGGLSVALLEPVTNALCLAVQQCGRMAWPDLWATRTDGICSAESKALPSFRV